MKVVGRDLSTTEGPCVIVTCDVEPADDEFLSPSVRLQGVLALRRPPRMLVPPWLAALLHLL